MFHLTFPSLEGHPLGDSVLGTAVLPKWRRSANSSICMAPGPGTFIGSSLDVRHLHPLEMDIGLEILPSH